jgi:hypothetical protein
MTLAPGDLFAIQQLNARYAAALDDLVPDSASRWAETFTPDGSFTLIAGDGKTIVVQANGAAELVALQRSFPDPHSTRHWFNNIVIEANDPGARMTSYIVALIVKQAPAVIARTGTYDDRLVCVDGAWLFIRRTLTLDPGSHV